MNLVHLIAYLIAAAAPFQRFPTYGWDGGAGVGLMGLSAVRFKSNKRIAKREILR